MCNFSFPTCSACHFFKSIYSILVERLKNLQASDPRRTEVSKVKNNADVCKAKAKEINLFPLLWASTQSMIILMWR